VDVATLALSVVTGTVCLVLLGLLIWGLKTGQFSDVEEAKYQVFADPRRSSGDDDGPTEHDAAKELFDATTR